VVTAGVQLPLSHIEAASAPPWEVVSGCRAVAADARHALAAARALARRAPSAVLRVRVAGADRAVRVTARGAL